MKYARLPILTAVGFGMEPGLVEVSIRPGLPQFRIAGLSAGTARDAADRVRVALQSTGSRLPYASVTVALSPAETARRGSYFDLAIAAAILQADGAARFGSPLSEAHDGRTLFLGELSLSGHVTPVEGLAGFLVAAARNDIESVITALPRESLPEVPGIRVFGVGELRELVGERPLRRLAATERVKGAAVPGNLDRLLVAPRVKKALAASAAGRHSLLLLGPPGSGKTSLARELLSLLPPPDAGECLEILGASGLGDGAQHARADRVIRPFRSPHHSAKVAGIVGGGQPPRAGEATRAHLGILFLDEMTEFQRDALQALREPIEDGCVRLARGTGFVELPCRFLLVGAANPCPCGYFGDTRRACYCAAGARRTYMSRISGPLRDRIDMEVCVAQAAFQDTGDEGDCSDANLRSIVAGAVAMQRARYRDKPWRWNCDVPAEVLEESIVIPAAALENWERVAAPLGHRARAGVRRLARTLADLAQVAEIRSSDVEEAHAYRFPPAYREP